MTSLGQLRKFEYELGIGCYQEINSVRYNVTLIMKKCAYLETEVFREWNGI